MFARSRSQSARERTAEDRRRAREERERNRGVDMPELPPPAVEEAPPIVEEAPPSTVSTVAEELPPVVEEAPPTVEVPIPAPVEEAPAMVEQAPPAVKVLIPASVEEAPAMVEHAPPAVEVPIPASVEEAPAMVEHAPPAVEVPIRSSVEAMAQEPSPPVVPIRPDARIGKRVSRLRKQRGDAHRWYRRLPARLGALLALVVIAGAIVLLVRSLGGSSQPPPPPPLRIVKITIPEGFTRAQIAALAKADGLRGSYMDASVRSPSLHPTHYGAPASTPNLEGFLFPATYELYSTSSSQHLVEDQIAAFRENFTDATLRRARELGVTPYGLLTIASMIEREAATEHDRPLVAAVIYNRLHQNMPLGIDSTLRYALNDFSQPLTEAQLRDPSPYNTRLHRGLPPTPISNPGRMAILAAAHPAHAGYLYYVAAPDGCGGLVFSDGISEFEHDAALYREAIANNHGRVPTCKKR